MCSLIASYPKLIYVYMTAICGNFHYLPPHFAEPFIAFHGVFTDPQATRIFSLGDIEG